MSIPGFYSPLRVIGLVEAWHDDNACPIWRSSAPADRRQGMGITARCQYCELLEPLDSRDRLAELANSSEPQEPIRIAAVEHYAAPVNFSTLA